MEAILYVKDHLDEFIQIITMAIGIASIIVRLTPTLRDDHVLKGIIKFVGKYIALNR